MKDIRWNKHGEVDIIDSTQASTTGGFLYHVHYRMFCHRDGRLHLANLWGSDSGSFAMPKYWTYA